ncbi:MAG: sugar-binding protein [Verrucomicrobiae bacterium]
MTTIASIHPMRLSTIPRLGRAFAAALILISFLGSPLARGEDAVETRKVLEDFSAGVWGPSSFVTAPGSTEAVAERPSDLSSGGSMKVTIPFSGQGFEHFTACPAKPLYIPGDVRRITMRVKRSDKRASVKVIFVDGWGRTSEAQKDLKWDVKLDPKPDWQTVTFDVPADWVRPVAISGIASHNFSFKAEKASVEYVLGGIEAETNLSDVDPATGLLRSWKPDPAPADAAKALKQVPATPLVSVNLSTTEQANIFAGKPPAVTIQIVNWKPGALEGKASFRVTDQNGTEVQAWEEAVRVEATMARTYPLKADRFGIYTVAVKIACPDNPGLEKTMALAKVPVLPEPTEAQKIASPYGINYHGGGARLFDAFKKTGIYWYREYSFRLDGMRRAKGADRSYKGWPNYPALLADYDRYGLICLPVLFSLEPPVVADGKTIRLGPDRKWTLDIADILISFPKIRFWELGNEYDLKYAMNERAVGWENYNLYHKKFGELVALLGDGQMVAVEQGRAGMYPVFVEQAVKSGAFDHISVANSHHYTGTEPPETNADNFNSGERLPEGRRPGSFFDTLRAAKRAACSDGKPREHWLTEFGWDTLAGPIVTPAQQAAYLQRGFLLSFAAGTDKAFWFFNFDVDEVKAAHFFDGCGLINYRHEPKLSFAAMAGLSSILPRPVYVGSINAGPNTAGYVFENDGKLVAGLWVVTGEKGPGVSFQADAIYDFLGNKLEGLSAPLQSFPLYAVGLKKSDPFYAQTAYGIESNHAIVACSDDAVEVAVRVTNNRDKPLDGTAAIVPPAGWPLIQGDSSYSVPPGEVRDLVLKFSVPAKQEVGKVAGVVNFQEAGRVVKAMPIDIVVQKQFLLEIMPLEGQPGQTTVDVKIENRSAQVQDGILSWKLPSTWQAATSEIPVAALKPGERRTLKIDLTWSADWKLGESALATFKSSKGTSLQAPIIPNRFSLQRAKNLKLDGNLGEWGKEMNIPDWMLGSTRGDADARLWLAWAPEGLYGAAEVKNSKGHVKNPREFWDGDALELFLSTGPSKKINEFENGDHQFWLVPNFDENRVFLGQWKAKDEIPGNRYDIPGVKSAARRTADGYVMEFLIPAAAFQQFSPRAGEEFGVAASLSVRGTDSAREVFWPRKKDANVRTMPMTWGKMKLVE